MLMDQMHGLPFQSLSKSEPFIAHCVDKVVGYADHFPLVRFIAAPSRSKDYLLSFHPRHYHPDVRAINDMHLAVSVAPVEPMFPRMVRRGGHRVSR